MVNYVVGIDVGTHSVGFAAIELDSDGLPIRLLNSLSQIHDSGVDPEQSKRAITRLAASGTARRTRRLYRRKRRRLAELDNLIKELGWPLYEFEHYQDPQAPWKFRAELASRKIENKAELEEKLSVALRHIARHRGWRNPYSRVQTLFKQAPASDSFLKIKSEFEEKFQMRIPDDYTIAQILCSKNVTGVKLRGTDGVLDSARLQQSDHANELLKIFELQNLPKELWDRLISAVFKAESPKGSAAERVGRDPLQPKLYRALKASDAFQRYRIVSLIANLRIREGSNKRHLTLDEKQLLVDFLAEFSVKKEATWIDVAQALGIDRGDLLGTATLTDDGERAGNKPPVHETNRRIANSKFKKLANWWQEADAPARSAMLNALSNAEVDDFDSEAGALVQAFFVGLEDIEFEELEKLRLPIGRAAYSEDTLVRLTSRMLNEGLDLHEARKVEFGIADDWAPPAPDISERVGNPAVDRVLKIVGRWLNRIEAEYGAPQSINIEHVREGFMSESETRKTIKEIEKRTQRNLKNIEEMHAELGISGPAKRSELFRYQAYQRQNGTCAYCGDPISYKTMQMDHIVPRAGIGSTNTRENLVATCSRCNKDKSNLPFAVWAERSGIKNVSLAAAIERTNHWLHDSGSSEKEFRAFKEAVIQRYKRRSEDDEIDPRSMESVGWMANELRARIHQKFSAQGTKVRVFRGAITASARKASGLEWNILLLGGKGKNRLDRRHHAVDAAVIALMSAYVAQTLAIKENLKNQQQILNQPPQWKEFIGHTPAHQIEFNKWLKKMQLVTELLNQAFIEDRIVVTSNLRLRLGNGSSHKAKIKPLTYLAVGSELSMEQIDRASSEALWVALTREADFDWKNGLPANPDRLIRVNGTRYAAGDLISFFGESAGSIPVRGGYAELGSAFHHARIYKINGKDPSYAMMRVYTVDLLKHRNDDLFNVELKPQSISVRQSESNLRTALRDGSAEYLGWIVQDDELLIDMGVFNSNLINPFKAEFSSINRWRIYGFSSNAQLRLRPVILSSEGMDADKKYMKEILDHPGWRVAVNKVFGKGKATVIRRDSLGVPRLRSSANLPITWQAR